MSYTSRTRCAHFLHCWGKFRAKLWACSSKLAFHDFSYNCRRSSFCSLLTRVNESSWSPVQFARWRELREDSDYVQNTIKSNRSSYSNAHRLGLLFNNKNHTFATSTTGSQTKQCRQLPDSKFVLTALGLVGISRSDVRWIIAAMTSLPIDVTLNVRGQVWLLWMRSTVSVPPHDLSDLPPRIQPMLLWEGT